MSDQDRQRRYEDRRRRILAAARERAEAEGWPAVTTRHLAQAIGFTQPVLYGHFPGGKAEIMLAVALEGFVELGERCRAAIGSKESRGAVEAVAHAYLDFADEHPAIYEAMFREPIGARFAEEGNEAELHESFAILAEVIGDPISTEVFWGALHGVGLLERSGRMKQGERRLRVAELGARFASGLHD
ncbi:MAG: TetR/AcrR family transcriptional regulator [Brevibacterium sp.]|uniref:TetR family transcriptional regulator n=1 Tax=Brevibacterium aurantiacum TaxID=273384 RepID=A0A2A3Z9V3_BREAU|nr:TetR/AcrR family transcriptional regulator [Brevibacterium aurantiacum]PCC48309.1 TetR family transcriptional regulator [Brevibacterium aurantiacum]